MLPPLRDGTRVRCGIAPNAVSARLSGRIIRAQKESIGQAKVVAFGAVGIKFTLDPILVCQ